MKAVLQRVNYANVEIDKKIKGEIEKGYMIRLGVGANDDESDVRILTEKIAKLRIFTDDNDKMNLSLKDVDGEALVVSNFTLLANYRKGNRPDYLNSASPAEANRLYEYFVSLVREQIKSVGTGRFGEHMAVSMVGDGPVTIVLDSKVLLKK